MLRIPNKIKGYLMIYEQKVNFEIPEEVIKLHGNIINCIESIYTTDFNKIVVEHGEYTDVCYDSKIEKYLHGPRVEITYTWSNGAIEKCRCYIGRSTGILPVYLELKTIRSSGGDPVTMRCFTDIKEIKKSNPKVAR